MHFSFRIVLFFLCLLITPYDIFAQLSKQNVENWNTKQPSRFTENKGQVTDQYGNLRNDVKYIYSAPGFNVIFKSNGFSYEVFTVEKKSQSNISESTGKKEEDIIIEKFRNPEIDNVKTQRIDIILPVANSNATIIAEGKSDDYKNYYLTNTKEKDIKKVYSFSKLTYKNIWPQIDLVFYAKKEGELKYDIVVHPGGNLNDVVFAYAGVHKMNIVNGSLSLQTHLGNLHESIPISYTKQDQAKVNITYTKSGNAISFKGHYDKSKTLVIDPIINWSTYFGGSQDDAGKGITNDKNGNIYTSGYTFSSGNIASSGAYQTSYNDSSDAFLIKMSSTGQKLWATYFGGSNSDVANGVACDSFGNIYAAGTTYSANSISTAGAHQTKFDRDPLSYTTFSDAFIVKFDNTGARIWSSYYGGNNIDAGTAISCDIAGNAFLVGYTKSKSKIATKGTHKDTMAGLIYNTYYNGFLTKFDSTGKRKWATYYGGDDVYDFLYAIYIDSKSDIYLAGSTNTSGGNHITVYNSFQNTYSGKRDAFVVKFDSSGVRSLSSYYGGYNEDDGTGVICDTAGNYYLTGTTRSANNIFSKGCYQWMNSGTYGGGYADAFLVKFNKFGQREWGTFYGGSKDDFSNGITLDTAENVYLIGTAQSADAVSSPAGHQTKYKGNSDAFLVKFNPSGNREWASYYGGGDADYGNGIICNETGNIYITGSTKSKDAYDTSNAFQTTIGGKEDAFISKFSLQDLSLNRVLNIPSVICNKDSFRVSAVVKNNLTKADTIIKLTITVAGPDTFIIQDSLPRTIAQNNSDTLHFSKYVFFKTAGKYVITTAISEEDDNGKNDIIQTPITVYNCADFNVLSSCADTMMHFQKIDFAFADTMQYHWDFGDGDTSAVKNPDKKYAAYGFYNVTLKAKTSRVINTIVKKIAYFPKPTADFTYTNRCLDTAITFQNTSSIPADSITTYYWTFGNGKFSKLKNPTHRYTQAGKYTVKLIVELVNGCTDSIKKTITIYPKPKANFKMNGRCISFSTNFYDTSNLANGVIKYYRWYFGDGNKSTSKNPVHLYKSSGWYIVSLVTITEFGCADSTAQYIEIVPASKADFIASNSCQGDSLTLVNKSTAGVSDNLDKYLWYFSDNTISTDKNPSKIFTDTGTYTVKLKVYSKAGCADSITKTITIYDKPVVSFTNSSNCITDPITFTNTSTVKFGSIKSCFWDFGDGKTSTLTNPSKTFFSTGIHKVKLVVTSSNGCKDSVTQNVEIFYKPQPNFNVSHTCESDSVNFINISKPGADTIASNVWSFGDGDSSTAYNPTHKYASPGTYSVSLTVTNNHGCSRTLTKNIVIHPNAKAGFTANNICFNSGVSFTNNTSITGGNISIYEWRFGDGSTSTQENPSHTYATAGKYKVVLIATTDKGCIDSVSDSINIFPLPTADFETNNICQSEEATFTSKSTLTTEWLWDFGDSTTSTSENPTHKYFSAGIYMVKLKVKSINGCVDSITRQIEVYEMPEAIFSVSNICVTDSFALTDLSKGATNWFWDFGDGFTATLQHPKHKYDKTGTYTIYLTSTNSNNCSDLLSKQIVVYDIPKANFYANDICITDSLQIIDSTQNAASYVWNFGDNTTSTLKNPSHKYQSAGTYTISLTISNNNGCKDSISRIVTVDSTCVWPGDANADKIVDNKDILAIGLAYSDTGSSRTDTSTLWKGNIVINWSSNFSSGANYKHADSDGNGIVNNTDTNPVTRNYTKTHSKKQNSNRGKNTDPVFKIEIQNDSLKAGDTLLAYIVIGENALPAKDVYGLAFSLNYNEDYLFAPQIDFSGSWLGNSIIGYSNFTNGFDVALTRIDQQNVTGYGKIAAIKLIVHKDAEINTKQLKLEILDNILISADEQKIPVNIEDDSVKIYKEPNSIFSKAKSVQPEISIYPNPFNNQTFIVYELQQPAQVNIVLYDINGRSQILLPSQVISQGKHQYIVDANKYNLSSGVYLVKVEIDGIPVHKRIVKLK